MESSIRNLHLNTSLLTASAPLNQEEMTPSTTIDALTSALVARYLRTNNYSETLQAFLREAELPPDVGQTSGEDTNTWTIQSLLEEKRAFDHSVNFERYGEEGKENDLWSVPGESWISSCVGAICREDAVPAGEDFATNSF